MAGKTQKHKISIRTSAGVIEGEYKEHTYVKFPYVTLNIVIYKPGKCEAVEYYNKGKHYADAVITVGKKASQGLTVIGYDDLPIIKEAIDKAIEILNDEDDDNKIDPTKITDFDDVI